MSTIKNWLTALAVMIPLALVATSQANAQSSPASARDPDTGLLCLSIACNYVRSPKSVKCICKKTVHVKNRRRSVSLDCKIFRTEQSCSL